MKRIRLNILTEKGVSMSYTCINQLQADRLLDSLSRKFKCAFSVLQVAL